MIPKEPPGWNPVIEVSMPRKFEILLQLINKQNLFGTTFA